MKTARTPRAPRQCEIAADEGYNLAGAPVLLAKLTAYVSRPVFAQLAAIATQAGGEYSRHNTAFMFPIDAPQARESFAQQARVILTNPQPAAPEAPRTATQARAQSHRAARAAQSTAEAREFAAQLAAAHARAADEPPAPLSTITDRTPATDAPDLDDEADIASRQALQARRRADRADDPEALAAEDRAEAADYTARQYAAIIQPALF